MSDGPIIKRRRPSGGNTDDPAAAPVVPPTISAPAATPAQQPVPAAAPLKNPKTSPAIIVLLVVIATALPVAAFLTYTKISKPALETVQPKVNTPPTPTPAPSPSPTSAPASSVTEQPMPTAAPPFVTTKPSVDSEAVLAAVRWMAAYWEHASSKVEDIAQSRKDKERFGKYPDMKSAADAAQDDIEIARQQIADYKHKCAVEAATVLQQSKLDPIAVRKIVEGEQRKSVNEGNAERQSAAAAMLKILVGAPGSEDRFVGHAIKTLDQFFPHE